LLRSRASAADTDVAAAAAARAAAAPAGSMYTLMTMYYYKMGISAWLLHGYKQYAAWLALSPD
jgi:hypothetical protein